MRVCRVCLCSKPRKDITQLDHLDPTKNGSKQCYKHVILFCLGLQIDISSNMSTKLCVKCYRKIIQFYQFKTLAHKNDAHFRTIDSPKLKSEVFLEDDHIKIEKITDDSDCDNQDEPLFHVKDCDNQDEPLIHVKDFDSQDEPLIHVKDFDSQDEPLIHVKEEEDKAEDLIYEIKSEYHEDQSDEEFLSALKTIKYQTAEETKENAPLQKKKGRPKKPKTEKLKVEIKSKICDECGKEVKDLRNHLLMHVPMELRKQLKCELCDKVYTSSHARRLHVKRKHLAVKKQCHLCERSVINLKQHILTIHETESLRFQCVPCGRRFLSQAKLDGHVSVHTKDRPFECDVCGNKFRIKLSLMNHKRQVHDKERTHLCQFCSKSFFKKNHLQVHLRSHTKEKPYKCPECGKQLQSSSTLRNHRLIHKVEKNHKCPMCDMTFVSSNYLRSHLISHTKLKRYPCQYCSTKFHRSDHRKRHEFTAHLKHNSAVATA